MQRTAKHPRFCFTALLSDTFPFRQLVAGFSCLFNPGMAGGQPPCLIEVLHSLAVLAQFRAGHSPPELDFAVRWVEGYGPVEVPTIGQVAGARPGLSDHREREHQENRERAGLQAKRQIPRVQHSTTISLGHGGLINDHVAGAGNLNVHRA